MTLDADLTELMWDRAKHQAFTKYDAYGAPTYSAVTTTHPVRVENKFRLLKHKDGRDILAQGRIYFAPSSTGGFPGVTVQSKVTLSDGTHPRIVLATKEPDDEGTYYECAYFG